jgi:hypothetical protein
MPKPKPLPDVALIQLGPEVHSTLNELAELSGETKSEIVRRALRGLALAQKDGFWVNVLIELNILLAEMTEEGADSGIIESQEARKLVRALDDVRQRLYGRLDEIDGFPSIHWSPKEGDQVRSYADVQKLRSQRSALIKPDLTGVRRLVDRFMDECYDASRATKAVGGRGSATGGGGSKNKPSRR